jgi:hypothetical protein
VKEVLKHWIGYDLGNLARIRNGMPNMWVPHDYKTNSTQSGGWTLQGGPFGDGSLRLAQNRLKELLCLLARHHYRKDDILNGAIYAMLLRQLSPEGYLPPSGPDDPGNPHDAILHGRLNELFGKAPPRYLYEACDELLDTLKRELAEHGMPEVSESGPERQ